MQKIVLIGLGMISRTHLESIPDAKDFELTYVCDIDEENVKKIAKKYKTKYEIDYTKIPLDEIDVVTIATPNNLHYEMAKYFLKNKKHVLIEKPATIEISHMHELIKLAKEKKKHIFAVKQVRFNPAVRELKKIIEANQLGDLLSCNLTMHWNRNDEYFASADWRKTKKEGGGSFLIQGIHYIDLLVWMFGKVKSVSALVDTLNHDIEVEDHVSAIIRFENGAIGTVEFNVNTYPHNLECTTFFQGTKGSVKLGGKAVNEIDMWHVEDVPEPKLGDGRAPLVYAEGKYVGSCPNHVCTYQNMADVLEGRSDIISTSGEDTLKTLSVIDAIYRSSESGSTVILK